MLWIYVDHSKKGEYEYNGKVYKDGVKVFSCEAESILEADIRFQKETGIHPVKAPSVGCLQCVAVKVAPGVKDALAGYLERLHGVMARRLGKEWCASIEREAKKG